MDKPVSGRKMIPTRNSGWRLEAIQLSGSSNHHLCKDSQAREIQHSQTRYPKDSSQRQKSPNILTSSVASLAPNQSAKLQTAADTSIEPLTDSLERSSLFNRASNMQQKTKTTETIFQTQAAKPPARPATPIIPTWDTYIPYPCPTSTRQPTALCCSPSPSLKTGDGATSRKSSEVIASETIKRVIKSTSILDVPRAPPQTNFTAAPTLSMPFSNSTRTQSVPAKESSRTHARWTKPPFPSSSVCNINSQRESAHRYYQEQEVRTTSPNAKSSLPLSNSRSVESKAATAERQRPHTTDVVARRLIGRALGINFAKKENDISQKSARTRNPQQHNTNNDGE